VSKIAAGTDGNVQEEIAAVMATVGTHVWQARVTLWVIKPLMHLLTMAYAAGLLYVGTWIVVLALRHSGAI
jgi:hypothetical protein